MLVAFHTKSKKAHVHAVKHGKGQTNGRVDRLASMNQQVQDLPTIVHHRRRTNGAGIRQ
ncbi:hypothetical protein [Snodgrassella sp. ESL0253]|uniref:hypothetical protein n=1 Tax=Snodgrassella sp. ESL0253 TaxID=2705031 RepID=UPI001581D3F5|nr:hypothetical protein [Snodgrassella sp. ESL0253]NUE67335.1 hypothetical protein [Snodgrassella sp. ESL0253]